MRQVTRVLDSVGVNQQKLEGLASSLSPGKLEELAARLTRVADRLHPRCQRDALRQSCPNSDRRVRRVFGNDHRRTGRPLISRELPEGQRESCLDDSPRAAAALLAGQFLLLPSPGRHNPSGNVDVEYRGLSSKGL